MDYKKLIGYGKKKKVVKEQPKPRVNKVLKDIKQELNESAVALGIQTMKDNPPFKTSQQMNEGPAYEYKKHIKKIDKLYDAYWDAVKDFGKVLEKKGLKKESKEMHKKYYKGVLGFKAWFKGWVRSLL